MLEILAEIFSESWLVLVQMAPYLMLGFLVAGVLSACVSPAWVERHLGSRGLGPVVKASLYGIPLPLCSCGVIPVSASIRRHGASRAATTAFLLSTPQTGVDSIAVTYALLGPVFAVFRPLSALITGLVGGGLVHVFGEANGPDTAEALNRVGCDEACCSEGSPRNIVVRILHYGFVVLPGDIGIALAVGILIAGAVAALVPQGCLEAAIGGGVFSILLMMAAGIPVYVCATASVPIAAGLIHMGASPGAALAFLIAGPATNTAAFATIWKVLGRRVAVIYLLTVVASAITGGLLLDWLTPGTGAAMPHISSHVHPEVGQGWISQAGAVVLLAVVAWSALSRIRAGNVEAGETDGIPPHLCRLELKVTGMHCSHCADTVRRVLLEIDRVKSAEVDLATGRVTVQGDSLDSDRIKGAVSGLGYGVEVK